MDAAQEQLSKGSKQEHGGLGVVPNERGIVAQSVSLLQHFGLWILGGGAIVVAVGTWAIGSYNNALSVSLSATRRPVPSEAGGSREDSVVLGVLLKKQGVTRVRLDGCSVEIKTLNGASTLMEKLSREVSESLSQDFRGTEGAVSLVPGDEVSYQEYFRVPHEQPIHVKVVIRGVQEMFEWKDVAWPAWPASIVILPSDSGGDAGATSAL